MVFAAPESVAETSLSSMSSATEASTEMSFVASVFSSPVSGSVPDTEDVRSAWSDSALTSSAPVFTSRLISLFTAESP